MANAGRHASAQPNNARPSESGARTATEPSATARASTRARAGSRAQPDGADRAAMLTRKESAAYLCICLATLDNLGIAKTRIARRVFYRQDVLDRWIDGATEKRKAGKA